MFHLNGVNLKEESTVSKNGKIKHEKNKDIFRMMDNNYIASLRATSPQQNNEMNGSREKKAIEIKLIYFC